MTTDAHPNAEPAPQVEQRGRSTIEFTYHDQDDALEVAQAVRDVGGTECTWEQLAAQLKQASTGGGFRMKVMSARMYGALTYERGAISLTELGIRLVDPKFTKAARAESFLRVPLFKAAYEKLKGNSLPPIPAIERLLESLGVAPKQKDKARQVFIRAAKQAGYFDLDSDRLVAPPVGAVSPAKTDVTPDSHLGNGAGEKSLHPFIQGLIDKLPPPDSEWSLANRAKWLTTAANIFDLMYTSGKDEDTAGIHVTLEGSTLSVAKGHL